MFDSRQFLGIALLFVGTFAVAEPAKIQSVRIADGNDRTRVALDLSEASAHKIFTLTNPDRVVVDIKPGRIVNSALPLPGGTGIVRGVRSANRPDGSVRVVLDLAGKARPKSFLLAADGQRRDRLVIDLFPAGQLPPTQLNVPAPPAAKPVPVKRAPTVIAGGGRDIVIAIDPGHGGKDPGARGPSGVREKDVVLGISQRLASAVNREPGMRAVLTRSSDRFIDLRQRMEQARSSKADLFISIHADAFRDRNVDGATVYVLSSKGATDEASRRLAERENTAALIGGVELGDKDDMLASVLMDLSQNAAMGASFDVGEEILDELGQLTKVRKRTVQRAPFLVLKSPDVPSVLIETAYISNPRDEKNLSSHNHQDRMAQAIFSGVRDYFYSNPPEGTRVADLARTGYRGRVAHVIRRGDTLSDIANHYHVSVHRIRSENQLKGDTIKVGQVLRIPATHEI
jgi:N-acetylmuramoyl-L-alanine amidase